MNKTEKVVKAFETAYKDMVNLITKKDRKVINYTDIETFEDAYDIVYDSQTAIGETLIEEYKNIISVFPEESYYNALAKLRIVVFAANGCDESFPDWDNSSQEKRYPYYVMSGFRFYVTYCDSSNSDVGSRLCFKDATRCKYVAEHKNFKPLYQIVFNQ